MSIQSKEPKLSIELIPTTCHYSNVRTTVTTKQWNKIRMLSYESADHKCEICNQIGKNQGFKHNVECHEIWEYDDENHIQKLIGLISLCPICHQVKHIGRALAMGKAKIVFDQLALVNNWTPKQVEEYIAESFQIHKQRSKYKWSLDLSILTIEPYNLIIKLDSKRIFEIKKYKKKRKNSTTKTTVINKRPKKK